MESHRPSFSSDSAIKIGHSACYSTSLSGVTVSPGLGLLFQSKYYFPKCPGFKNKSCFLQILQLYH